MDAIMDLSARAVSLITLIQDCFLRAPVHRERENRPKPCNNLETVFNEGFHVNLENFIVELLQKEKECQSKVAGIIMKERADGLKQRIFDLVWLSEQAPKEADVIPTTQYLISLCTSLNFWIIKHSNILSGKLGKEGAFSPPFRWQEAICEILYVNKKDTVNEEGMLNGVPPRIDLAKRLEYLPIDIILALNGGIYDAHEQRVLQWWPTSAGENQTGLFLAKREMELSRHFQQAVLKQSGNKETVDDEASEWFDKKVTELLNSYSKLTDALLAHEVPLSFEYVFTQELAEITRSRDLREKELQVLGEQVLEASTKGDGQINGVVLKRERESPKSCDPYIHAGTMKLTALTFSGGGIRSATFNLGILQAFAKYGIISHVDYLSTVSGGGYIGSWLTTWIKRDGSVNKVNDRLCPGKSQDPLGEEVRPIRWLRMFSNYFAPNKSLMSVDSWTIGTTWLRNTLVNQVVIFSFLLCLMFLIQAVFLLWQSDTRWGDPLTQLSVYITTCVLMCLLACLTGLGMLWYDKGTLPTLPLGFAKMDRIIIAILGISFFGSYIVSATLYAHVDLSFQEKVKVLIPGALVTLFILLLIAGFGRYDQCIKVVVKSRLRANWIIVYTAILSAIIGGLALIGVWELMTFIKKGSDQAQADAIAFTVGVGLILLVFGITVVARMALLGKFFPDERREWWGRMGAVINRTAFIWVLLSASIFLLRRYIVELSTLSGTISISGWIALVGGTVKAAFSENTSGKEERKGAFATALNLFSMTGPYLFMLGLLVFLPALIDPISNNTPFLDALEPHKWANSLVLSLVFLLLALRLSWRLGINEFSMHHFYRNRLVRAYLGATRRKAVREKTANPFTNFDRNDDEKLANYTCDQGYYGPYPIINTALNASQVSDLSRQDRKAESFIFSPLYCGFDFSEVRASGNNVFKSYDYGFRQTKEYAYPDNGPAIGTAVAISGAAVNPNQGYHSSSATAFLLTVFNVQMGWWIGNPRKRKWKESDPSFALAYLVKNLLGRTSTRNEFVCLTDGGHFDNMGLYEMVRRRCRFIIVCDSEQDENFTCEGFANAIRRCRIDFGAEIIISVENIVNRENNRSEKHYALGDIFYSGDKTPGKLLYIKSSITGDENVDISEYVQKNKTFPHQSTADQFFDEEQFESYRKLGMHVADTALTDPEVTAHLDLHTRMQSRPPQSFKKGLAFKQLISYLKNWAP